MDAEGFLKHIENKFAPDIVEKELIGQKRARVKITKEAMVEAAKYLYHEKGFRFVIASAFDTGKSLDILYHFSFDATGLIANIHVSMAYDEAEVQTLTEVFPAANWIEREMHELFGIVFLGHPNLEKLISEGNWAEGVYPYRR